MYVDLDFSDGKSGYSLIFICAALRAQGDKVWF